MGIHFQASCEHRRLFTIMEHQSCWFVQEHKVEYARCRDLERALWSLARADIGSLRFPFTMDTSFDKHVTILQCIPKTWGTIPRQYQRTRRFTRRTIITLDARAPRWRCETSIIVDGKLAEMVRRMQRPPLRQVWSRLVQPSRQRCQPRDRHYTRRIQSWTRASQLFVHEWVWALERGKRQTSGSSWIILASWSVLKTLKYWNNCYYLNFANS